MATDIRVSELKEPVDVATYLFTRIKQLGIDFIHGVPGDYNLVALDYVPLCDLKSVGNRNELKAGYAADGYARVKGISAVVTTFGVGELSLLNAIAGAYAEYVPIFHIAGIPSTISQRAGTMLHHTLGNGDFNIFANMSANLAVSVAKLDDPAQKEVEALFSDKDFCAAPYLQFVELYIQKEDVPAALELTAKAAAQNNSKED